jgi:mono/diheme cytochrome c family protein
VVLWAAFLALGAACQSSAASSCPAVPADPACPDAAPSFAQVVYPQVFQVSCVPCHSPGGEESQKPLTTYAQITGSNGAMVHDIYSQVFEACLMPPAGAAQVLTESQRQTLLDWLGCGYPDN